MAEPIERFSLPREDWYDSEGRIYKDTLIENFNAIEAKLQELNALNIIDITIPDVSDIELDDVTLASDDNKIINLNSFLNITHLEDYPIELEFNGKKVSKITWWHNNTYHSARNVDTEVDESTGQTLVYFNPTTGDITHGGDASDWAERGYILIAQYFNGQMRSIKSGTALVCNLLEALAKMPIENVAKNISTNINDTTYQNAGRAVGWAETETKSFNNTCWGNICIWNLDLLFKDTGRYYA